MPTSELHTRMEKASLDASDVAVTDSKDLNRLPSKMKPKRVPDLHRGTELAIECTCFQNGGTAKLEKFGDTYGRLILVIPVPDNFTEIWLYDPSRDCVVEKFSRNLKKVRANILTCSKCSYTWTQRSKDYPKMCPRCKRRDWQEETKLVNAETPTIR